MDCESRANIESIGNGSDITNNLLVEEGSEEKLWSLTVSGKVNKPLPANHRLVLFLQSKGDSGLMPEEVSVTGGNWHGKLYFGESQQTEYVASLKMLGSDAAILIDYHYMIGDDKKLWVPIPKLPSDATNCDSRQFRVVTALPT